jgi:hypothetical protein
MRPLNYCLIFGKITKMRPFKFSEGYRAAEFYLLVIHADDFPITSPGAALNSDFLADLERVGAKKCYLVHKSSNNTECHIY